jgi:RNA polymerase sigma-70 factor, ECF subfamily
MEQHSCGVSGRGRPQFFLAIETHRDYLLRYALAKLRDHQLAEDVVQEALLAALTSAESFAGEATLRTWLTGILKFKIIDCQRRNTSDRARFVVADEGEVDELTDPQWFEPLFDHTGHWRAKFGTWALPDAALEQKKLFEAFERCMEKLPPLAARVFFMREIDGETTDEICKAYGITPSNCWVILHRARVSLRACLERNWFGPDS